MYFHFLHYTGLLLYKCGELSLKTTFKNIFKKYLKLWWLVNIITNGSYSNN